MRNIFAPEWPDISSLLLPINLPNLIGQANWETQHLIGSLPVGQWEWQISQTWNWYFFLCISLSLFFFKHSSRWVTRVGPFGWFSADTTVNEMSVSLPKDSAGTNDYAGKPKCARCRHHGIIVPKKGHTKICPFLKCQCWKCYLITERTKIAALQREMKRAVKETRPGARRVNAQGDKAFGTSNPDGGAPSTSEPMCPPPAYPWSRPEAGGQPESVCRDSRDVLPSAGGKFTPLTKLILLIMKYETLSSTDWINVKWESR